MSIRVLIAAIVFSAALLSATQPDHHLLTFSATDKTEHFRTRLPNGLRVEVDKDDIGWVVGVFRGKSKDSLLYPQVNWHGAWPCQVSAWSHKQKTFPDIRVITVRGYQMRLVIDLSNVSSTGATENEIFTGGAIKISWRAGA